MSGQDNMWIPFSYKAEMEMALKDLQLAGAAGVCVQNRTVMEKLLHLTKTFVTVTFPKSKKVILSMQIRCSVIIGGICGLVGNATTFVGGDVGPDSFPTCSALVGWQWTFGSRTAWLVENQLGKPSLINRRRA